MPLVLLLLAFQLSPSDAVANFRELRDDLYASKGGRWKIVQQVWTLANGSGG